MKPKACLFGYGELQDKPETERDCNDPRLTIPDDKKFRQCNITVRAIRYDDAGDWRCVVRDWSLGHEDHHTFHLNIVSQVGSPKIHVSITNALLERIHSVRFYNVKFLPPTQNPKSMKSARILSQ